MHPNHFQADPYNDDMPILSFQAYYPSYMDVPYEEYIYAPTLSSPMPLPLADDFTFELFDSEELLRESRQIFGPDKKKRRPRRRRSKKSVSVDDGEVEDDDEEVQTAIKSEDPEELSESAATNPIELLTQSSSSTCSDEEPKKRRRRRRRHRRSPKTGAGDAKDAGLNCTAQLFDEPASPQASDYTESHFDRLSMTLRRALSFHEQVPGMFDARLSLSASTTDLDIDLDALLDTDEEDVDFE